MTPSDQAKEILKAIVESDASLSDRVRKVFKKDLEEDFTVSFSRIQALFEVSSSSENHKPDA
jgi:hypothetical protein